MSVVQLGRLTIQPIIELEAPFLPIRELLPALTAELLDANRSWIPGRQLDQDGVAHLVFQSFLVTTPSHRILVDSCIGNDKQSKRPLFHMRRTEAFLRALKAAGLAPDDIDIVMCTHMHADHVGWNTRLEDGRWVPTFPKARYVFGQREYDHWSAMHAAAAIPVYAESVLPIIEAGRAELVGDAFELDDSMRLLPTPGHTPGHLAVIFGGRGGEVAFAGDLLHTPLQIRFPELSVAFDNDMAMAAQSRRSFLERFCDTSTLCCFAHFPMELNGRIRRWDHGFRCEPMR